MNSIHDLGGMQGFGAVVREENGPVFHEDWERHVFAVLNLTIAAGQYHVDEIRHSIERMPPAEYLPRPTTSTGSTPLRICSTRKAS